MKRLSNADAQVVLTALYEAAPELHTARVGRGPFGPEDQDARLPIRHPEVQGWPIIEALVYAVQHGCKEVADYAAPRLLRICLLGSGKNLDDAIDILQQVVKELVFEETGSQTIH